jgi:SagB-type dehydrogenase family enzyme
MTVTPLADGDHDLLALDDMWEATSLDRWRAPRLAARVAAYAATSPDVPPLLGAGPVVPLRPVRDRLHRLLAARRSGRVFGGPPLRHRHLERLLAAVGPAGDGRRTVPEAGGLDAVHAYAVVRRARGPLGRTVVRYDHHAHAAQVVAAAPTDDHLRAVFQIEGDTLPQAVVVLVVDLAAVTAKYGARGGRFALQQVGHAAQNLSLRLAADGLTGYLLGAALDREVLEVVGVAHTGVRYGGALACGH